MKQTEEQKNFSKKFNELFEIEDGDNCVLASHVWYVITTQFEYKNDNNLFDKIIDGVIFNYLTQPYNDINMKMGISFTKPTREIIDFIADNFSAKQAKQLTHDEIGFIASNVLSNADLCCDTTNNMLRFFVHIVNTIISILDDGILYTDEEF